MSQYPFAQPPQQPGIWGAPQQPQYAAAPQFAAPPQQYAAPQFAAPMTQQYGQQPWGMPPAAQHVPAGDIAAFMGQPKTGRPKSISWNGAPDGATVSGIVVEDVSDRDVVPDTDPKTNAVKTFRDGTPKYVLVITIGVQPSLLYPEGKASLYCRGDLWEKLSAAMAAAGRTGAPKAGDMLSATLVERRQGSGTVPKNIFRAQYVTSDGVVGESAKEQAPTVTHEQQPQAAAPAQTSIPDAPQYAQPQQPPAQQYAQAVAPVASYPAQAASFPPAAASAPAIPAGLPQMSPEQAALLAKIRGGQS